MSQRQTNYVPPKRGFSGASAIRMFVLAMRAEVVPPAYTLGSRPKKLPWRQRRRWRPW